MATMSVATNSVTATSLSLALQLLLWIRLVAPSAAQTTQQPEILPEICSIKPSPDHTLRVWCPFVQYSDVRDVIPADATHLAVIHSDVTVLNLGELHLPRLQQLVLTNNEIRAIIPNGSMAELRNLFLGSNAITKLNDGDFETLPRLERLVLAGNGMREISGKPFRGLRELKGLNLDNNSLDTLPCGVFSDLGSINYITLSHNHVTLLMACAFEGGVRNLRTLQLSHNDIEFIHPMTFKNLSQLKTLILAHNALSDIDPSTFEGLTSLEKLSLEANHLLSIGNDIFLNIPQLHVLTLSKNPLNRVESNAFESLSKLQELYLREMTELESVENDGFAGLGNLTKLAMEGNPKLKTLSSDIIPHDVSTVTCLLRLRELHLANCGLTSLDEQLFKALPALEVATVQGNPLDCDSA